MLSIVIAIFVRSIRRLHCKEMIERLFRTAKKYHNLPYTREEREFSYFKCIKIVEVLIQNIKRQTSKECLSLLYPCMRKGSPDL